MGTRTAEFGAGRREAHDASSFYARFTAPALSADGVVAGPAAVRSRIGDGCIVGDARSMDAVPTGSVALVVTSPPYFAGKEYEAALGEGHVPGSYIEFLEMLHDVFRECERVLEPGGRIAVNVANLGRKPFRSLSADVIRILQDDLKLLLRGEIVWLKAEGASGSCAWGSFRSPANPVLRDVTERIVIASKGRFDRATRMRDRAAAGLPSASTVTTDEFLDATIDVWRIPPESARRVGHPAPFPVELPERLIHLYTYEGDVVLDPFLGSGSTLVAAARTGRIGVGYDTDPRYVDIARPRLASREATPDSDGDGRWRLASATAKPIVAIAADMLVAAGFAATATDVRIPQVGRVVALARDATGAEWVVDVAGAFTVVPGGLARSDVAWRAIGRAAVLRKIWPERHVLLLTSHLPTRNSEADAALRAAGPGVVFDVVPLLDPAGAARLATYAARGAGGGPLAGFWAPE